MFHRGYLPAQHSHYHSLAAAGIVFAAFFGDMLIREAMCGFCPDIPWKLVPGNLSYFRFLAKYAYLEEVK